MLRPIARALLTLFFRVEIRGKEHYASAGERALIVINPGSLLDPLLIGAMLPDRITLAVDRKVARKWWMRPILALMDTIQVDFSSPTSTLSLVRAIQKHKRCMVFHGGRFQNDPYFMRVLEAAGLIAEKAHATLLPIRIDGAAYSRFSYFRNKVRLRWFPKVCLTMLPPQKLEAPADLPPRQRRKRTAVQLYSVMTDLLFGSAKVDHNILQAYMDAVAVYGRSYTIAEDQDRHTLTYGSMLIKFQALGRTLGRVFAGEERVGFMLPSSLPGVVAFLGLHVTGKVPAMLNFTAGAAPVVSGCHTVELKSVLTSRKFIKLGDLQPLENALRAAGLRIVYLEDVAASMPLRDKLGGFVAAMLRRAPSTPPESPVAILFTSGTEGMPKAVFMSHRNARANCEQMLSIVNVNSGDRLFNCLPMFHTFGLGIGTLLPLLNGMRVFLYPSPLHYRIVPQLFYESLSTVICGTDTFFTGYARYGRPYDFFNARLVIAGAEKLREVTARTWKEKYGVTMLEGYGATETSPVIAVNTPANAFPGSVGRLAPGMSYKVKPVPGLACDHDEVVGELWVKGDNVMLGYMRASAPGVLEPPVDPDVFRPELLSTDELPSEKRPEANKSIKEDKISRVSVPRVSVPRASAPRVSVPFVEGAAANVSVARSAEAAGEAAGDAFGAASAEKNAGRANTEEKGLKDTLAVGEASGFGVQGFGSSSEAAPEPVSGTVLAYGGTPLQDDDGRGWYDTGDIVHVNAENYIFIKGRAKRFAKVGGEMISLAAVEGALRDLWPDVPLGVVAVRDARKGEQLVLIIEHEQVSTSRIAAHFASRGLSPLWTPKKILSVKQAPILGTGKFDYVTAKAMAEKATNPGNAA